MIGCLRTRVRKQPIIALYYEFENELENYNLEARFSNLQPHGFLTDFYPTMVTDSSSGTFELMRFWYYLQLEAAGSLSSRGRAIVACIKYGSR